GTVVGVAADDGGPAVGVVVDADRSVQGPPGASGRVVRRPSLPARPAEVDTSARQDVVDLLPRRLADVADPQRAVRAVHGRTPRVAETPVEDEPLVGVLRV